MFIHCNNASHCYTRHAHRCLPLSAHNTFIIWTLYHLSSLTTPLGWRLPLLDKNRSAKITLASRLSSAVGDGFCFFTLPQTKAWDCVTLQLPDFSSFHVYLCVSIITIFYSFSSSFNHSLSYLLFLLHKCTISISKWQCTFSCVPFKKHSYYPTEYPYCIEYQTFKLCPSSRLIYGLLSLPVFLYPYCISFTCSHK